MLAKLLFVAILFARKCCDLFGDSFADLLSDSFDYPSADPFGDRLRDLFGDSSGDPFGDPFAELLGDPFDYYWMFKFISFASDSRASQRTETTSKTLEHHE